MKGEPDQPRCGFSKQTIAVLSEYKDLSYKTFDILRDNEVGVYSFTLLLKIRI